MARRDTFTFRVDKDEKEMLERLSASLQRSQSDAVRLILREAFKSLVNKEGNKETERVVTQD